MTTITYQALPEGACLTYEKGGGCFTLGTQRPDGTWVLHNIPLRVGKPAPPGGTHQEPPFSDMTLLLTYLCQLHSFKSYKLEVKTPRLK